MDIKRVSSYLGENPVAFAGLRALDVSDNGREKTVAEGDEVPFIFSTVFVPMITVYAVMKRTLYHLRRGLSDEDTKFDSPPDDIFVMTSSHRYRTYTFEEVGKRLLDKNRNVMFLCSPSATGGMDRWEQTGFQTESFQNLLRFVSVTSLFISLVQSVVTMYKLRSITAGDFPGSSVTYGFNSLFLEFIKVSSIEHIVTDEPSIHTYSLMPYQVETTDPEHLHVYQHGSQESPSENDWGAITFFPANLLLWGKAWVDTFERLSHNRTQIRVTGSPWHDYLSELNSNHTTDWDVLLLGGSQVVTHSEKRKKMYEALVTSVINACENNEWSLAIKLHPQGSGEWYNEHGWGNYVVEFDSLSSALSSTKVAVTHFSSAFVESIALGIPVILSEPFCHGLSGIRPILGASFVENENIEQQINDLRRSDLDTNKIINNNQIVDIGQSTDQILNAVLRN